MRGSFKYSMCRRLSVKKMKSSRRRSAYSVYQLQSKTDNELLKSEEEINSQSTEPKRKRCEESSSSSRPKKSGRKVERSTSFAEDHVQNGVTDLESHSPIIAESKHKGKGKLLSKANKLRQSLTLSSRRKKRNGYRNCDGDQTKLSTTTSVDSSVDLEKTEPTDSETGTDQAEDENQLNGEPEETEAERLFAWLISPVKPSKFFSDLWEQKPLLIKRHQLSYNDGWFSTKELDRILREHGVQFSINLDVTSYKNGVRETHNPLGRAFAPVVWDFYQNDCSVRFLNPQAFSQSVWKLTSLLQEYFGCLVGANIYLTPPGSQGFAPHYDDIEAFVLQLEGRKHWRLYNPRGDVETLPRYSSANFTQEEIGKPVLDTELSAGDMLYFPRGTIHQADTPSDTHSLHITLSTYQKNSWFDFMEKLIPRALQIAFEEDLDFRQGLPLNYLDYMGVTNSDSNSKDRTDFLRKVEKLMMKLISHAPVDAAADQLAVGVLRDCLPPVLTEREQRKSIFGSESKWEDGKICNVVSIDQNTEVRLIRKGAVRLVVEGDGLVLHHTMENSRVYHDHEMDSLELGLEAGPAIECIFRRFPNYTKVKDLPHEDINFKVDLVAVLYEKGILIRK